MGKRRVLKCRDTALLEFELGEDFFGTPEARVLEVNEAASHLLPWGLRVDGEGLYRWLSVRAIPQNRRYAEELCRAMGFSAGDVERVHSVSLGLSLNDSYWVPEAGDGRSFAEVNLFENGFSAVLAAVAYTGAAPDGGSPHGLTPELTTDGTLHKAWRIAADGTRVLYKGASNGWFPGEPVSELIASHIARAAGLDAVRYGLDTWEAELCSTCACFCDPVVSYTPFAVAAGVRDLGAAMGFCWQLGADTLEALRDMLVLDCLLMNNDRHFTNFGLLRDVGTGRALGLGPVFDNGRALLPMLTSDMLPEARYQVGTMSPAFGGRSFGELASRVMGPRQSEWVGSLADIDLSLLAGAYEGTALEAVVSERCSGLQAIVRERASELSRVRPVPAEEMAPMLDKAWEAKGMSSDRGCYCPAAPIPGPGAGFERIASAAERASNIAGLPLHPRESLDAER